MKNVKKNFPIFRQNPTLTYLDSASTSQKPQQVIDAVNEYYTSYTANIHRGLYPIAERATKAVERVRDKTAKFINAKSSEEIIFTKSATEAINLVMYSWGKNNIKNSDTVMTTVMEHHSNFVPWQELAKEKNATFQVVNITNDGLLKEDEILKYAKTTKVFAFCYISNMLGTINPISKIIKKIREKNKDIVILIDAAQAVPHKKVNVQELDCDFLVFSGHKMLAETGIGVLYAKATLLDAMQPFLYGGDMIREVSIEKTTFAAFPSKFEAGTINISGIISLGEAIDYLEEIGMERIQQHEKKLTRYCLEEMQKIDGIRIFGPSDMFKKSGVISFSLDSMHAHDIAQVLGDKGICVRSGHHCTMPLHTRLGVTASTRASFYMYNDDEDIDRLIRGLKEVKKIFQ